MRKVPKIYFLISLTALAFFLIAITTKRRDKEIVEELLAKPRAELKDFNESIAIRNNFYYHLDTLIENGYFKEALSIIDTARIYQPLKLGYIGVINSKQRKYRESIGYFTEAIELEGTGFSKFIAYRADAYDKLNLFDSALADYRLLTSFNYDFEKSIAETYEKMNQKDSAIKYYQSFLQHYPDSLTIEKKLVKLTNGG